MPKMGIHPALHRMTVVLRNGATYEVSTVLKPNRPFRLQTVSVNLLIGVAGNAEGHSCLTLYLPALYCTALHCMHDQAFATSHTCTAGNLTSNCDFHMMAMCDTPLHQSLNSSL